MNYEHDRSKRRRKHAPVKSLPAVEAKVIARPAFSPAWMPRADIRETDTEYMIDVALPGVIKEDVRAEVLGDVLTVSGERRRGREAATGSLVRRESSYGPFIRSFNLPEGLHTEDVKASFKDGLLTLTLRKPPEFKSRGVSINVD
jgi:HSP20 family protein